VAHPGSDVAPLGVAAEYRRELREAAGPAPSSVPNCPHPGHPTPWAPGARSGSHWYCDVSATAFFASPSPSTGAVARTTVTVHSDSATTVDDTLPR